jgi:hypothetical protein
MSRAQPKPSARRSRRASEATKPTKSPIKRRKVKTAAPAETAPDKRRNASRTTAPPRATKPHKAPKALAAGKASGSAARRPRAVAESSTRDARRQSALPVLAAESQENAAKAFEVEPKAPQLERPSVATVESAPPGGIERKAEPLSALPRTTPQSSPATSVMKANAEIHRLMTSRADAAIDFATSLARCRSPMDVWLAQIRFASAFLLPRSLRDVS